jgi:hypothetical protein
MTVYVLTHTTDGAVIGVYSTIRKAEAVAERLRRDGWSGTIQQCKINPNEED